MSDNMQRPGGRRSRLGLAIVASGLLVLLVSANVAAAGPDTSTSSRTGNQSPAGDGATRINPDPAVLDLHRQGWDHIRVSPDGKRLTVYFWMGVQACNGLGRVDVSRHNGQVKIQLWTGIQPDAMNKVCVEMAQLFKTVVHLNRPIILNRPFLGGGVS